MFAKALSAKALKKYIYFDVLTNMLKQMKSTWL